MKRLYPLLFLFLLGAADMEEELDKAYQLSQGSPEERVQAMQLYETLARQGVADAQAHYGQNLLYGEMTEQNASEGLLWLHKAIDQGNGMAMRMLGEAYKVGQGVEKEIGLYLLWLRKGAEAGSIAAQFQLYKELISNEYLPVDNKEALFWLKKAAGQGSIPLRRIHAYLLLTGERGEQDIPWAVAELEVLVAKGSEKARLILAERALKGLYGSPVDPHRAIEWALPLAEQGDPEACEMVGQAYGTPPLLFETANQQKAVYWLTRPGDRMSEKSRVLMLYLSLAMHRDDPPEAIRQTRHWFRQIEDRKQAAKIFYPFVQYAFNSSIPFLMFNAPDLLDELVADHYPEAQLLNADLGLYGLSEATSLWRVASGYLQSAPHVQEANERARLLVQGDWDGIFARLPVEPWNRGTTTKSDAEAVLPDGATLRQAAEKGDTLAMWQLALRGIDEMGAPDEAARSWMKRAAEGGFVAAMMLLGSELDRGKTRDEAAAHAWLEKAALSGSTYGRYLLANHFFIFHSREKESVSKPISLLESLADDGVQAARAMLAFHLLIEMKGEIPLQRLEPLLRPLVEAGSGYATLALAKALINASPLTEEHLAQARNLLAEMAKRDLPIIQGFQAAVAELTPEGVPLPEEPNAQTLPILQEAASPDSLAEFYSESGSQLLTPDQYVLHRLGLVWQKRAARLGNGAAMKRLGHLHLLGYIVDIDTEAARQWYEQAAVTGDGEAGQLAALLARKAVDQARERVTLEACWYSRNPDKYWLDLDPAKIFTQS
ncbi:MAG: sel1 repeat family protein [Magnetococcales bacterium]|nr:sel1 repeat family protein [Magnetococcales bacterium]